VNTLERVEGALAGLKSSRATSRDETPVLELAPADIHEASRRLRDAAGFETNTFVTAIDRFPAEPRFEVYWQFLSLSHSDRVRFMARVGERMHPSGADGAGDAEQRSGLASVPSIIDLYPGAAFSERECYDMFGIVFDGHANL
jgi:NADH-quinone oxidoreductase subunit C